MEANEPNEIQEHVEHAAHDPSLRLPTISMSLLAVLVAIVSVLGHRSHTEAVLKQAQSSDEWALYQAKKIRQSDTSLTSDLLSVLAVNDQEKAAKLLESYKSHQEKWDEDLKEEQTRATELQNEVSLAERHADRFDLGEALLEIGLIVTSITLLTRNRMYWHMGLAFGAAGLALALSVYFVH